MSCTTCTKTNPIPQCSGILTLGAVSISDGVAIISDVITGQRRRMIPIEVTTGVATIDLDLLNGFLTPNFLYEISVYQSIEDFNNPATITIEDVAYTCFQMEFSDVINASNGEIEGALEFTLKIYEPNT